MEGIELICFVMWPVWKVNCRKGDTEQARGRCADDEAASCPGREMKFQHTGTVPDRDQTNHFDR